MFSAEVRQGIGGHDGIVADLTATYLGRFTDRLSHTAGLGLTYGDDEFMGTYFGIDAERSARSGRARYEAGAGLKDAGLFASLGYAVTDAIDMFALASYRRLLGDAADSPVVEEVDRVVLGLGASYKFSL